MASIQGLAKEVPVREIEGKIQLAQRIKEQASNILGRTSAMRSRLVGINEQASVDTSKPQPVRSELAELEHAMVEAQDVLNTVQIHLNDLERI